MVLKRILVFGAAVILATGPAFSNATDKKSTKAAKKSANAQTIQNSIQLISMVKKKK